MSWKIKQVLNRRRSEEQGVQVYSAGLRRPVAFVYPNIYRVGMSNLGMHILYQMINARGDCATERYFLPERELAEEHRRSKTPLLGMETGRKLADNEIIFVMLSFELDYDNLLTVLDLGKISTERKERGDKEPLVIIGGPCATFNPLPLCGVADAFVIGEGEETVQKILDLLPKSKDEMLRELAAVDGVFVPGISRSVTRQWIRSIDRYPHTSAIISASAEFGNMYVVEVARGCGRHCRFCMAGYCFRRPRFRTLEAILRDIQNRPAAAERIGLMGAAVSDHPFIRDIVRYLAKEKIKFSVASLRADTLDEDMCRALVYSGQSTLTVAPEAGSERLRRSINKGITEGHIMKSVEMAVLSGMQNIKLYFMIGLPGEEDEDIREMLQMILGIRQYMDSLENRGTLVVSVNPFVPKPFTPYQWQGLTSPGILRHRIKMLQVGLKGNKHIKLVTESLKETVLQAVLARGDEELGRYLVAAHKCGEPLKSYLQKHGISMENLATEQKPAVKSLPWDFIDIGVTRQYLLQEWEKSQKGEFTAGCFENCHRCGICKQ